MLCDICAVQPRGAGAARRRTTTASPWATSWRARATRTRSSSTTSSRWARRSGRPIRPQFERFPARHFVQFFDNHGLLHVRDQPQWRVIRGGSQPVRGADARALQRDASASTAPVAAVRRHADRVEIVAGGAAARDASTRRSSPPTATRRWRCSPTRRRCRARASSAPSAIRTTRRCCTPTPPCCPATGARGPAGTTTSRATDAGPGHRDLRHEPAAGAGRAGTRSASR